MWIGYARSDLIPRHAVIVVREAIHAYATRFGLGQGRFVFEPLAPELMVGELLRDLDRHHPVLAELAGLASLRGTELPTLLRPRARSAEHLWHLVHHTRHDGPVEVIVPSPDHLTDLTPSGRYAAERLATSPAFRLHLLQPDTGPAATTATAAIEPAETVIATSRIGAIPAAAQLDALTALTHHGYSDAIELVDALYVALIEDSATTAPAPSWLRSGTPDTPGDSYLRLLACEAGGHLVVELDEPRHRTDPPAAALTTLCLDIDRITHDGRTITRATLAATAAPLSGAPR